MFGLLRDLVVGLLLLGLLAVTPWFAERAMQQDSVADDPDSMIVPREPYFDLSVSRKKELFAAVGMQGQVTIGRIDQPLAGTPLDLPDRHVMSLQFSPRELSLLLGCLDGTVLWQPLEPLQEPRLLATFPNAVSAVSVSADGRLAAMATSPYQSEPAQIAVVEIASAQARMQVPSKQLIVWQSFSADGRELLCRDSCGSISIFEVASGKLLRTLDLNGFGIGPAAMSPNGRWLAVGGLQGTLAMIDLREHRIIRQWPASSAAILALAFSGRGTMLACGTSEQVLLLNTRNRQVVAVRPTGVQQILFTGDGKNLMTAGHDGTIRRWSVPRLQEEQRIISDPL
jgi:WD40 repeat protein